jgi:hypothetical protein
VALVGAALGGALVKSGLASTVLGDAVGVDALLPELVHATAKAASVRRLMVRATLGREIIIFPT